MVGYPKQRKLIIAIDGPSGAGKSTVGRSLAKRLGYVYIDTGAMYRAVALKAREGAIDTADQERLSRWVMSLRITFLFENGDSRIFCDGEDVTESIRSPEISLSASEISKMKGVREALVQMQKEMGKRGGVVLEGRDIGTVVFPDAEVKFYLDADPQERARRRFEELVKKGIPARFEETLEEVLRRDHNDMSRSISPLVKAGDAVLIDSTRLSLDEVVEKMVRVIQGKGR